MSTLSQDLDFFDRSLFDPLAQTRTRSLSTISVSLEANVEGKEKEEEEEDAVDEEEGEVERREEGEDAPGEKTASTPESFRSSLWSEKESTVPGTPDSWDLPSGPIAWDENEKPMERLLTYADLTLTEEEENGLLTDRIVAACSSYLTETPGNKCHVVAKVMLNNKNLNDVRILSYHRFLQYVDLSWNNLTDLRALGCLRYLMYLDVSHNLLEEVLPFKPPLNLTYVNYSHNQVWQIDDLSNFWALCYLDLSHNKISKIQGFQNLRYLRHLDLSHNQIETFGNLENLRITDLNLEYNLIWKFTTEETHGMNTMRNLKNLYLNNNLISSLGFLREAHGLKKLELQGNNISEPIELTNLKNLKNLRQLDMSGNPVAELKAYRQAVLSCVQDLKFLDRTEVNASERVAACNKSKFDVQLEAAWNSTRMILLEQLNDTSLDLDVLPVDQGPYPFVILVGPVASSKKYIVECLARKYPEKVRVGRIHTTREVLDSETNVLVNLEREEFAEMIKSGKFLCVTENLGHLYGFSREELAAAVKERKLCLTAMDMVSALTLHGHGIRPFLVLALLQSEERHLERLKQTYGPAVVRLGIAYLTLRQPADAHEGNVHDVAAILEDLISKVVQEASDSESVPPESLCSDWDARWGLQDKSGRRGEGEFPLSSDALPEKSSDRTAASSSGTDGDSVCYSATMQNCMPLSSWSTRKRLSQKWFFRGDCFQCSPVQCGFQASQMPQKTDSGSETEAYKRLSASQEDLKDCSTMTSHSACDPPPMRVEISSAEGSLFGENHPFLDWSTSLGGWSDVELEGLTVKEGTEVLCDDYLKNVISMRDVYQSLHLENPGLFSLSVFTDDEHKAIKDITKFLKQVWRSTPDRKPAFDPEKDLVYQAFVPRKLEKLKEMLRNDFRSADGDGTFKGLDDVAPLNSPASARAEVRSRGHGDFLQ